MYFVRRLPCLRYARLINLQLFCFRFFSAAVLVSFVYVPLFWFFVCVIGSGAAADPNNELLESVACLKINSFFICI